MNAHENAELEISALSVVGNMVCIPGTSYMGRVLMVDGPNWTALAPEGQGKRLVHHRAYITSYERPVVELKLSNPGPWGTSLLNVSLDEIEPGVTLHKA